MAGALHRIEGKFLTDTAWNYGAFAAMAASGVVLNFFIAAHFGIEALGVFNQIYAVYVVAAQFAVMGFHDSAQKHSAEMDDDPDGLATVSAAALLLAAAVGAVAAASLYALSGPIGWIADSLPVGKGVALVAPGLLFFAINKVLMGVLNGTRRMKAFAVAQTLRVAMILAACFVIAWAGWPGYALAASFTVAEMVLFPALIFMVRPHPTHFASSAALWRWLGVHFHFGARALINGFLAESYIRIDILMLAVFVSDREVGIYSFAALFIEGLYQVPVVFRTVVNPMLVRLIKAGDRTATAAFARKVMALSALVFVIAAGAVVAVFPWLGPYFPEGLVGESRPLLIILALGLGLYAAMIPMDHILLQAGRPGRQSLMMTANVLVNVVLNLALIPAFGTIGAAAATATAFLAASLLVNLAAWRWLGFSGGLALHGTRFDRN